MLALISIDNLHLVIPQNQILTLEPVEDLKPTDEQALAAGSISTESGELFAYNLSSQFEVLEFNRDRRIVIALSNSSQNYAILADELNILETHLVHWRDLPRAIFSEHSPIVQVAVMEGTLVCRTDAEILYQKVIRHTIDDSDRAA